MVLSNCLRRKRYRIKLITWSSIKSPENVRLHIFGVLILDTRAMLRNNILAQFCPMVIFCKTEVMDNLKKKYIEQTEVSIKHMDLHLEVKIKTGVKDETNISTLMVKIVGRRDSGQDSAASGAGLHGFRPGSATHPAPRKK